MRDSVDEDMAKKKTLKRKAAVTGTSSRRKDQASTKEEGRARSGRSAFYIAGWLKAWWIQVLAMALATLVCYGHTLHVPFYLDDFSSIVENPVVQNWGGWRELWDYAPLRVVGYVSFAVNHHFGQFQVAGYHVVNIVIHFLCRMCRPGPGKGVDIHPRGAPPVYTGGGTMDAFFHRAPFSRSSFADPGRHLHRSTAGIPCRIVLPVGPGLLRVGTCVGSGMETMPSDRRDRSLCGPCAFHETEHLHAAAGLVSG